LSFPLSHFFLILSQGHFGENDPFRPSSAHPLLSQAACERTLPLSHFFCLRTSSPKPSEANELTSERANKQTSMEVVASLLPLVAVTMATD
jgi:hypothetical protein